MQADQGQDKPVGDIYPEPNISIPREEEEVAGKEGMSAHEAHAPPLLRDQKTLSYRSSCQEEA